MNRDHWIRAAKTTFQVVVAVLLWAAADENVRSIIFKYYPQALPILAVTAGLVSVIQNVLMAKLTTGAHSGVSSV